MALWMEEGSQAKTSDEEADLLGISALKESAAIELKGKGNEYVKMGKKNYGDAIDCYTRAINQKTMNATNTSILYANRAHVHLLLGNYRRALSDAKDAAVLNPKNVKAQFRGAKAALALGLLNDAIHFCMAGLEEDPNNVELVQLKSMIKKKDAEVKEKEKHAVAVKEEAKDLISAISKRGIKMGKAMYKEHTGSRKPWLDANNLLHWPVLLLYGEVMSSDFIEDFCETDLFSVHLEFLFGKDAPSLQWDNNNYYQRSKIELYYKANEGPCLSKKQLLRYLLEDKAGLVNVEDDVEEDASSGIPGEELNPKWVKVHENSTLQDVLSQPNHIVAGIPVFYVVSTISSFYCDFLSERWSPP